MLHDSPSRVGPVILALRELGLHVRQIRCDQIFICPMHLLFDPEKMILLSLASPSAATRTTSETAQLESTLVQCAEASGVRVINGFSTYRLDHNKALQATVLTRAGISIPHSVLAKCNYRRLATISGVVHTPSLYDKPLTGGSGLGIRRIVPTKRSTLVTGVRLLQHGVEKVIKHSRDMRLFYRAEFVGNELVYVARALVPIRTVTACPCNPSAFNMYHEVSDPATHFSSATAWHKFVERVQTVFRAWKMELGSVEFTYVEETEDSECDFVVFDLNANTTYHPDIEQTRREAGKPTGISTMAAYVAKVAAHDYSEDEDGGFPSPQEEEGRAI